MDSIYQNPTMEVDIHRPSDCIKRVVQYRKTVFDKIEKKEPSRIWLKASFRDVKKVIIINSASRSGSSLLFTLLKKIPVIYSLSGESVPFYKLNGFSFDSFSSDEIPPGEMKKKVVRSVLSRDFLSDFSLNQTPRDIFNNNRLLDQYINDLALRFSLQWPQVSFSYELFNNLAKMALGTYKKNNRIFCKEEFYLELLWFLRRAYKAINPYYYDLPIKMIKRKFPRLKIPSGPPNNIVSIEEPPFILLSPSKKVSAEDLLRKSLLLKSSVDCYRMPFIESLFPRAEIKIIYLTRNPLGCINGLYDGWLHRGFFSHNLSFFFHKKKTGPKMLKIAGYSDRQEWGKWWWKYDLPPRWEDYTQYPLERVCAFQWHDANRAMQKYLHKGKKQYCLIRYESLIRSSESRRKEIGKILDFLGMRSDVVRRLELDVLPVIQATKKPQPFRWKRRKGLLVPLLDSPEISKMCVWLGYDKNNLKEWF